MMWKMLLSERRRARREKESEKATLSVPNYSHGFSPRVYFSLFRSHSDRFSPSLCFSRIVFLLSLSLVPSLSPVHFLSPSPLLSLFLVLSSYLVHFFSPFLYIFCSIFFFHLFLSFLSSCKFFSLSLIRSRCFFFLLSLSFSFSHLILFSSFSCSLFYRSLFFLFFSTFSSLFFLFALFSSHFFLSVIDDVPLTFARRETRKK